MVLQKQSPRDRIVSAMVVAGMSIIPACVCSYATAILWWLVQFGGEDDMSFLFEGPYIIAYRISGPTAFEVGRVIWPLWSAMLWVSWGIMAVVVWRRYARRSGSMRLGS